MVFLALGEAGSTGYLKSLPLLHSRGPGLLCPSVKHSPSRACIIQPIPSPDLSNHWMPNPAALLETSASSHSVGLPDIGSSHHSAAQLGSNTQNCPERPQQKQAGSQAAAPSAAPSICGAGVGCAHYGAWHD